ncbi:MAG: YebC/PmpR family DNA-binding transcriptional regulator [Kiritimatiellia bacterium]
MSGHSKWSTIKHKKAAIDAKRGKIFSKVAREIMVAVRTGGSDPEGNITLRALLQKARSANMPSDNIDRAIKKGAGDLGGAVLEEMTYEGYAGGGVAILIGVLTDNKNRSAAEIRHLFTRHNASLSAAGSVSRLFERRGQIVVSAEAASEDKLMEIALEAGADDMANEGDHFEILTSPSAFMSVVDALNKAGIVMAGSEMTMLPFTWVPITDKGQASSLVKFVEALEDLDDVQNVWHNGDISDDLMAEIEG